MGRHRGNLSLSLRTAKSLERQRDPHRWNKPRANLRNAYGYLQPTFNIGILVRTTILSTFTAVISDSPNLVDGDLKIINATEAPISTTPLPSTWTMLIAGFVGIGFFAYRGSKRNAVALVAA